MFLPGINPNISFHDRYDWLPPKRGSALRHQGATGSLHVSHHTGSPAAWWPVTEEKHNQPQKPWSTLSCNKNIGKNASLKVDNIKPIHEEQGYNNFLKFSCPGEHLFWYLVAPTVFLVAPQFFFTIRIFDQQFIWLMITNPVHCGIGHIRLKINW